MMMVLLLFIFLHGEISINYLDLSLTAEEININHFSADVKENLIQIADWLITHNEDDFMNVKSVRIKFTPDKALFSMVSFQSQVYARFRASTVQKTLHGLRDHLRSSSIGATGHQGVSPTVPSGTSTLVSKSLSFPISSLP